MSLYAVVNSYGFLETPYRKVLKIEHGNTTKMKVTNEIVYLAADDEQSHAITHAEITLDAQGYIVDERVPIRIKEILLRVMRSLLSISMLYHDKWLVHQRLSSHFWLMMKQIELSWELICNVSLCRFFGLNLQWLVREWKLLLLHLWVGLLVQKMMVLSRTQMRLW